MRSSVVALGITRQFGLHNAVAASHLGPGFSMAIERIKPLKLLIVELATKRAMHNCETRCRPIGVVKCRQTDANFRMRCIVIASFSHRSIARNHLNKI